jgi:hypothetical protein
LTALRFLSLLLSAAVLGGAASRETTLAGRYRAGRIIVRADEDWTSNLPPDLVFESRGDIAVAPDGSVFVSNTTRHTIYKFDPSGRFAKRFGQPGQGPGDLTYPGRLSILDGRYLVVGEYATNRRISLFGLDGTFVKIVGTGRFTSNAQALGDGKIAYVSLNGRMEADEIVNQAEVYVIDWRSGAQKAVWKHEIRMPVQRMPGGGLISSGNAGVILARTRTGGIIVGTTQGSELDILTADGVKVRTLDTGWKAVPVTAKYRDELRALERRRAEAEGHRPPAIDMHLPEALEVLQDVWTDDQGNILVCRKTDCLEDCPLEIRVYSPEGDLLCDFEVQPGPFILSADHRFKRIVMISRGLYGLLELKDDPDGFLHLIRTVYR